MTIFGRAGSTTNVGEVGLVITFSSVLGKIGGTDETNSISLTKVDGGKIGSITTVPSASLPPVDWDDKWADRDTRHPTQQRPPRSKYLLHP